VRISVDRRYIPDSRVSVGVKAGNIAILSMQLPSSAHRDVVPDHIDPIPFPETLQEAQLLCRLMDVNIRLAVPRDSIEGSGGHAPHRCTSHPDPCGA